MTFTQTVTTNYADLTPWQTFQLVMLAYTVWQIVFRDKVTEKWRRRVHNRFPHDQHKYFGHTYSGPHLTKYNPDLGLVTQAVDAKGLLLWHPERGPGGWPVTVEDPVSGAMVPASPSTVRYPTSEPVLVNSGQHEVVVGTGLGNFLRCPRCTGWWVTVVTVLVGYGLFPGVTQHVAAFCTIVVGADYVRKIFG
jgi:Protein of unknown function (DUF1360)